VVQGSRKPHRGEGALKRTRGGGQSIPSIRKTKAKASKRNTRGGYKKRNGGEKRTAGEHPQNKKPLKTKKKEEGGRSQHV